MLAVWKPFKSENKNVLILILVTFRMSVSDDIPPSPLPLLPHQTQLAVVCLVMVFLMHTGLAVGFKVRRSLAAWLWVEFLAILSR